MNDALNMILFVVAAASVVTLLFLWASTEAKRHLAVRLLAMADAEDASKSAFRNAHARLKVAYLPKEDKRMPVDIRDEA